MFCKDQECRARSSSTKRLHLPLDPVAQGAAGMMIMDDTDLYPVPDMVRDMEEIQVRNIYIQSPPFPLDLSPHNN